MKVWPCGGGVGGSLLPLQLSNGPAIVIVLGGVSSRESIRLGALLKSSRASLKVFKALSSRP